MNDPDLDDILFDDDIIPDDDYIGVENDEDEEIGVDYLSMEDAPLEDHQPEHARAERREQKPDPARSSKKRAKIKKMPPGLLRKMPDVASMLITKANGRQVLLVNPKYYR